MKKAFVLFGLVCSLQALPYLQAPLRSASTNMNWQAISDSCLSTSAENRGTSQFADCQTGGECFNMSAGLFGSPFGAALAVAFAPYTCGTNPATGTQWPMRNTAQTRGNPTVSDSISAQSFGVESTFGLLIAVGGNVATCFIQAPEAAVVYYPQNCPNNKGAGGGGNTGPYGIGAGGHEGGGYCSDGSTCADDGFCGDGSTCTYCDDGSECWDGYCADETSCEDVVSQEGGGGNGSGCVDGSACVDNACYSDGSYCDTGSDSGGGGCDYCSYDYTDPNCGGNSESGYCPPISN